MTGHAKWSECLQTDILCLTDRTKNFLQNAYIFFEPGPICKDNLKVVRWGFEVVFIVLREEVGEPVPLSTNATEATS